jgi:hypothetical protein
VQKGNEQKLEQVTFAGLWDVCPSRTLRLNGYGESLESRVWRSDH